MNAPTQYQQDVDRRSSSEKTSGNPISASVRPDPAHELAHFEDAGSATALATPIGLDSLPASQTTVLRRRNPTWKRLLDIGVVLIWAPALVPLTLLIAAYIKLVSRGPALFIQSRLGHGAENFRIYKFRTMHVPDKSRDDEHRKYVASMNGNDGPVAKPDIRASLIPGGRLLRATSLDELPQLINVLNGTMSLVGPRPDLLQREDYAPEQLRRFEVVPGMTGLWQVSGKNRTSFDEMIDLDVRYIENQSLSTDLFILFKTVLVLLTEGNE